MNEIRLDPTPFGEDMGFLIAENDKLRARIARLEEVLRLAINEYIDDCYCRDEVPGQKCVNCEIRAALAEEKNA